jgi:hypothetical protein
MSFVHWIYEFCTLDMWGLDQFGNACVYVCTLSVVWCEQTDQGKVGRLPSRLPIEGGEFFFGILGQNIISNLVHPSSLQLGFVSGFAISATKYCLR